MTATEIQTMVGCVAILIVIILSCIPECMLITTYDVFSEAPISLKLYVVIHVAILIIAVLWLSWLRPPSDYVVWF